MARRVYVFNVPKKTEVEEIGEEKEQKNEKKDTIPRLTEKDAIRSWTVLTFFIFSYSHIFKKLL
jgi:hypothetical protein